MPAGRYGNEQIGLSVEIQTYKHRHTDIQADAQTQAHRHADAQTNRPSDIQAYKQMSLPHRPPYNSFFKAIHISDRMTIPLRVGINQFEEISI